MLQLLAVLVTATVLTLNAVAFDLRAAALQGQWRAAEAGGVSATDLAPAQRDLAAQEARWVGPLPYAATSGALLADPFGKAEAAGRRGTATAMDRARGRAAAALARLHAASGPNDGAVYAANLVRLAETRRPADADALARSWTAAAARQTATRQALAQASGGLDPNGLPADVVAATDGLDQLAEQADAQGLSLTGVGAAIADGDLYLGMSTQAMLVRHAAIVTELQNATAALQHRVDLRASADQLLAQVPPLIGQAANYGAGPEFQARADQVEASLAAAKAAGADDQLDAALQSLRTLVDDLHAAAGGRLPVTGIACQPGAPARMIVIHLATQQLVAYENGCPILRTPVTTGRPALPTGRGTFQIFAKYPMYHMVSPWPLGSPFYYPPTWVGDAMEFIGNGTFLHSADWEPDAAFGPDSEDGPYASHGCVHVLPGPLQQLYDWAAIGTTVVVGD